MGQDGGTVNTAKLDELLQEENLNIERIRRKMKDCLEDGIIQISSPKSLERFCELLLKPHQKYQYKTSVEFLKRFEYNHRPVVDGIRENHIFEFVKIHQAFSQDKNSQSFLEMTKETLIRCLQSLCTETEESQMWVFENLIKDDRHNIEISLCDSESVNLRAIILSSSSDGLASELLLELQNLVESWSRNGSDKIGELTSCLAHRSILSHTLTQNLSMQVQVGSTDHLKILTNFGVESPIITEYVMTQFEKSPKSVDLIRYMLIVAGERALETILKEHLLSKNREIRSAISESLRTSNHHGITTKLEEWVTEYASESHTHLPYVLQYYVSCNNSNSYEFLVNLSEKVGKSAQGCIDRGINYLGRDFDPIDFLSRVMNRGGPVTESKVVLYRNRD